MMMSLLSSVSAAAIGAVLGIIFIGGVSAPEISRSHRYVDTFVANGTWTCPADVTSVQVECWGAGAGSTSNNNKGGTGQGGGGGAYSIETAQAVTPTTNYTIVVGTSAANTTGGDSYFNNASTVMAKGGVRGADGGAGGAAASGVGDTKYSGGNGTSGSGDASGGGSAGDSGAGSGSTGGQTNGAAAPTGNFAIGWVPGGGAGKSSTASDQQAGARGEVRITYDADAPAGFPVIKSRSWDHSNGSTTSFAVAMPSGITAGDLLIAIVSVDTAPTLSASGWTSLHAEVVSTTSKAEIFYKTAAGGDTLTVGSTASVPMAVIVLRIEGGGTPETTATNSNSSTNTNPASHTPTGGSKKYLWIVALAGRQQAGQRVFDRPSGYGGFVRIGAQTQSVNAILAVADRHNEASSEDPGAWTNTNNQVESFVISIPPA